MGSHYHWQPSEIDALYIDDALFHFQQIQDVSKQITAQIAAQTRA